MSSVIVAGAGPAGATAAKKLAEKGIDVICIDRYKFPREKVCGGALSIQLLKTHPDLEKYVETNVLAGCIASGDNKYILDYDSGERLGALVQRSVFDTSLLMEAKKAGAEIIESERILNVKTSPHGVFITTDKNEYNSDVVLGAGGVNDIVAKSVGLNPKWHPRHLVLAYIIETEFSEGIMDQYFSAKRRLYFHLGFGGSDGYGWVFPKKKHLNVGFGAVMHSNLKIREQFLNYINFCQTLKIIPPIESPKLQAALIPIRHILPKIFADRCLLLGDAAGFVNPINGEGIHYAIRSGEIASNLVSRMIRSGDFAMKNLKEYQFQCMREFGKNLQGLQLLSKLLLNHSALIIKTATKDQMLKDLALKLVQNAGDIKTTKRNLIKRFIRALIVNTLKK